MIHKGVALEDSGSVVAPVRAAGDDQVVGASRTDRIDKGLHADGDILVALFAVLLDGSTSSMVPFVNVSSVAPGFPGDVVRLVEMPKITPGWLRYRMAASFQKAAWNLRREAETMH